MVTDTEMVETLQQQRVGVVMIRPEGRHVAGLPGLNPAFTAGLTKSTIYNNERGQQFARHKLEPRVKGAVTEDKRLSCVQYRYAV